MIAPALPVLYSFRRCPYAIRARMALRYAGVAVAVHEVALREKPAALLTASPKGTVPVLLTSHGEVIDQSLDIMLWALHQRDPDGWLVAGQADETWRWIALNDDTFKPLLDRYKYAGHHLDLTPDEHRSHALAAMIQPMDVQLQKTTWLSGPHISLADIALFPFVRQFAGVDKSWFDALPLPALQKWLNAWLASLLFNGVMEKAPGQTPAHPDSIKLAA